MARGNGNGSGYPNPRNETGPGDGPDVTGQGIYFGGWDEINEYHLKVSASMYETPNSKSGHAVMGGVAPGEPDMADSGKEK